MSSVTRILHLLRSPTTEWTVIERETTQPLDLVRRYLAPLSAAVLLASIVGSLIVEMVPFPLAEILRLGVTAVLTFIATAVMMFVLAIVISELAPHVGGRSDVNRAFSVAMYAYTPSLVAGLGRAVPVIAGLAAFLGALYSLYLLYLGLTQVIKVPSDKTIGGTAFLAVTAIVGSFVLRSVMGHFLGAGLLGSRLTD